MCGSHDHPIDHHHQGQADHRAVFRPTRVFRAPRILPRSRRAFLGEFGKATLAVAVFSPVVAACGGDSADEAEGQTSTAAQSGDDEASEGSASESGSEQGSTADQGAPGDELRWGRVNRGFVSAYVLARGNAAAVVDTGTADSATAIGQTLQDLGLNFSDVNHVILTHHHQDHVGSVSEVVAAAESATVYAGQADLERFAITPEGEPLDPARIQALVGGEDVFGFEMLATPGHTAGHMAAIDHTAGLLVAGDAIFTEDGGATEGPERFFDDVPESQQSIRRLAELSFNTMLVGHGDPIEQGADSAVAALAASLP